MVWSSVSHVWPQCKCAKGAQREISQQMTICLIFFLHCICKLNSLALPSAFWLTVRWAAQHSILKQNPVISPALKVHHTLEVSCQCMGLLIYNAFRVITETERGKMSVIMEEKRHRFSQITFLNLTLKYSS